MSSEQKAIYHQVAGAGQGRVLRKFFELSDADMDAIQDQVDLAVSRALDKAS